MEEKPTVEPGDTGQNLLDKLINWNDPFEIEEKYHEKLKRYRGEHVLGWDKDDWVVHGLDRGTYGNFKGNHAGHAQGEAVAQLREEMTRLRVQVGRLEFTQGVSIRAIESAETLGTGVEMPLLYPPDPPVEPERPRTHRFDVFRQYGFPVVARARKQEQDFVCMVTGLKQSELPKEPRHHGRHHGPEQVRVYHLVSRKRVTKYVAARRVFYQRGYTRKFHPDNAENCLLLRDVVGELFDEGKLAFLPQDALKGTLPLVCVAFHKDAADYDGKPLLIDQSCGVLPYRRSLYYHAVSCQQMQRLRIEAGAPREDEIEYGESLEAILSLSVARSQASASFEWLRLAASQHVTADKSDDGKPPTSQSPQDEGKAAQDSSGEAEHVRAVDDARRKIMEAAAGD